VVEQGVNRFETGLPGTSELPAPHPLPVGFEAWAPAPARARAGQAVPAAALGSPLSLLRKPEHARQLGGEQAGNKV
jgi:hypothetical protein